MNDALLLTLDMVALVAFGLWGVKFMDQRQRDKRWKPTYVLTLPAQPMKAEQVHDFFCTVHGLVSTNSRFGSAPTMAFELWAQDGMKTPRLRIPAHLEEDVITQLHSAIPGLRIDKEDEPPRRVWVEVRELAMSNRERGLQPESPAAASRRISAAFNAVGKLETLAMQLDITGDGRKELPVKDETPRSQFSIIGAISAGGRATDDEIKDRRAKESELNFKATLRIAAVAETRERARQLINRVCNALAPTGTAYTYFRPRKFLGAKELQLRFDIAAGSTSWPNKLTVSEILRVCGWPVDTTPGIGFAPGRGMDLPPSHMLPEEGIVIGKTTYPGRQRHVALGWEESKYHTLLLGRTGTGKSTEIGSIAEQVMDAGHGLIVLEISGDLIKKVLDLVPEKRYEDVIVLDMEDDRFHIPFDPLLQGNRNAAVDEFLGILDAKLGRSAEMGAWAKEMMFHVAQAVANSPGVSFFDIMALLDPKDQEEKRWADKVIGAVTDPEQKRWWEVNRADRDWKKKVAPVRSRMWEFLGRPELRRVMGQGKTAFTWREVLLENKILLISLAGVPEDVRSMACAWYMQSLWRVIKSTPKDTLSYLVLDEAAEFVNGNMSIDLEKIAAQARKHNVPVILAAQQLSQFQSGLQKAVMQNMTSKVVFDTYPDDASPIARAMKITDAYFINQPKHEAIAQIYTDSGSAPAVSIKTLGPDEKRIEKSMANELIEQSRRLYGTPASQLRQQTADRRKPPDQPPPTARANPYKPIGDI